MNLIKAAWRAAMAIRWSVLACVAGVALAFLSMGLLGLGLYVAVSPVTRLRFPGMDEWHGDWVWPATLGAGMLWSFGFLLAGWLNHRLRTRTGVGRWPRRLAYLGVLWLWALLVWWLLLAGAPL